MMFKYNTCAIVKKTYSTECDDNNIEDIMASDCKIAYVVSDKNNVDNENIFESLNDIPFNIDIVIVEDYTIATFVILDEMELLDVKEIYFKRSSYNDMMMKKARELHLSVHIEEESLI